MYQLCWRKCSLARFFFSTKCSFWQLQTCIAHLMIVILCFRTKSEGLGDFSLLNNETTRMSTFWPGSWESSGSLLEPSTAAVSLLLLILGLLLLDSMLLLGTAVDDSIWRALHAHYSRKTARLFLNYALCFMLLRTDYSGNYASILDSSLTVHIKWPKIWIRSHSGHEQAE